MMGNYKKYPLAVGSMAHNHAEIFDFTTRQWIMIPNYPFESGISKKLKSRKFIEKMLVDFFVIITVVTQNKGTPNKGIFPYLTQKSQNGK